MPPLAGSPVLVWEVCDPGSLPVAPGSLAPTLAPKSSFYSPTEKPFDTRLKVSVAPGVGLTISDKVQPPPPPPPPPPQLHAVYR